MAPLEIVLILLSAVVVSGLCARMLPLPVPVPLMQIAIGVLIAAFANLGVRLDPQLFFVLFLPPLLFFDGWRLPKASLLRDKGAILALALGLVVFTVLGVGLLIHWMIPSMPLAVAFALAAVISPTDPVAVKAIAERVPVPKRLMRILEGEALLNDASGLVCMRFAVAAALTGTFSLVDAVGDFVWASAGGLAIGWAVTVVVARAKTFVSRHYGEDVGAQILISLLIPFGAYFLADLAGTSGILAAVAAGMTMGYVEQGGSALAETRVRRSVVWETIQFGASGVIFILLGEQLPRIASGAADVVREAGHGETVWLLFYVAAVTLGVLALRFAWVWMLVRVALSRPASDWRLVAALTLGGVRGTVTLAGILSLPFMLTDGSAFPARDLAVFLAAGVIIASLVAATVLLPNLLRHLQFPPEPGEEAAEDCARVAAGEAALAAIGRAQGRIARDPGDADLGAEAATRAMAPYRQRIDALARSGAERDLAHRIDALERELELVGIRAERDRLLQLVRTGRLSDEAARKLVREVDLVEARIASS
jgi:CPA1 family monovalent cation:H+ antiporter